MRAKRYLCLTLIALFAAVAASVISAAPARAASVITSAGPLTSIWLNDQLRCQVKHADDTLNSWYPGSSTLGVCAPIVHWNGRAYGGGIVSTATFTPVSTSVTGTGTPANPYRMTGVADIPDSPLRVTQVITYLTGQELYRNDVTVSNSSTTAQGGIFYTYGDCYLQSSDRGYGREFGRAAVCTSSPSPGSRIEALVPITGGNHWQQGKISNVYSHFAAGTHLEDRCECGTLQDNAAALSWDLTVPAGESATYSWNTVFSPGGVSPLVLDVAADTPTAQVGTTNGYVVTVCNPNVAEHELTSLSITLPASFTYEPTAQVGFFEGPPRGSTGEITWEGNIVIPPSGCKQMHFSVNVGTVTGTFTVDANATVTANEVTPATDTAPIEVTPVPAEDQFDLTVVKTVAPQPAIAGKPLTYTATVTNAGPATSLQYQLIDLLPVASPLQVSGTDPRCAQIEQTELGQRVTCTGDPLPAGGSSTFIIVAVPDGSLATGSQLVNSATVETEDGLRDPDPDNDTYALSVDVRNEVDVRLELAVDPSTVEQGQATMLAIGVHNSGPSTANNVGVLVTLPAGLAWGIPDKGTPDCTTVELVLTCQFPALVAGDPTFTIPVISAPNSGAVPPARYEITGQATVVADTNLSNNVAATWLFVTRPGALPITGGRSVLPWGLAAVALGVLALWCSRTGGTQRPTPHRRGRHG